MLGCLFAILKFVLSLKFTFSAHKRLAVCWFCLFSNAVLLLQIVPLVTTLIFTGLYQLFSTFAVLVVGFNVLVWFTGLFMSLHKVSSLRLENRTTVLAKESSFIIQVGDLLLVL